MGGEDQMEAVTNVQLVSSYMDGVNGNRPPPWNMDTLVINLKVAAGLPVQEYRPSGQEPSTKTTISPRGTRRGLIGHNQNITSPSQARTPRTRQALLGRLGNFFRGAKKMQEVPSLG